MVKRQISRAVLLSAILTLEAVTQEHVEPRESNVLGRCCVPLKRYHRWQLHRRGRAAYLLIVLGNHRHRVLDDTLDSVLPRPRGQREVAQGPVVGVQQKRRKGVRREHDLHPPFG